MVGAQGNQFERGGQQDVVAPARAFRTAKSCFFSTSLEGIRPPRRGIRKPSGFPLAQHGVTVLAAESDCRAALLTRRAFVIERGKVTGDMQI